MKRYRLSLRLPAGLGLLAGILTPVFVRPMAAVVTLYPGDDIQAAVNANPEGTTFVLKAGLYRMQSVKPKNGSVFRGEHGAILCGARLLTSFTREGAYWVATGQTQHGQVNGMVQAGYEGARYPEDLFFDDQPLRHVLSLPKVGPGTWYFDYDADKVYFFDDPTGRKVEIGVSRCAFSGTATKVTIQGLTVEKYAIPAQMGAIGDQYPPANWTVQDCETRLNHGTGIRMADGWKVRWNLIHTNGQMGTGGVGNDRRHARCIEPSGLSSLGPMMAASGCSCISP